MRLSAAEIYRAARGAGFDPAAAVMATAVALAESSGDPRALGDTTITTGTWGPSVGLWQVRTLRADTGRGTERDLAALTGDVAAQAAAAHRISNGGQDWTPWSVFTSGRYRNFLGQAQAAAGQDSSSSPDGTSSASPAAAWWDIGGQVSDAVSGARTLVLTVAFVVLGLALVGAGVARAVR